MAAGLRGGKGIPDSVESHPEVFATFTAPSFGAVHVRRVKRCKTLPCRPRDKSKVCPHGVRVGCITNDVAEWALRQRRRYGLEDGIGPWVVSGEVGVRKPDPRIFREALDRLGSDPAATVFVGDRLYDDVSGAQAVGMRTVQTRQFRQEDDPTYAPDAVIEHLRELPEMLRGLD